jgi:hypothetical protein
MFLYSNIYVRQAAEKPNVTSKSRLFSIVSSIICFVRKKKKSHVQTVIPTYVRTRVHSLLYFVCSSQEIYTAANIYIIYLLESTSKVRGSKYSTSKKSQQTAPESVGRVDSTYVLLVVLYYVHNMYKVLLDVDRR